MSDTFFTAAPHWTWWILLYFFIGGIAGTAFMLVSLLDWSATGSRQLPARPIVRLGYYLSFIGVLISGFLLTVDLNRPLRFWHMLVENHTGQPMFKGVELYSWQDPATQGWRFALLPGTNRRKAANEVRDSPGVVDSVGDLKARISQLAPAEQVFWQVPATGEFPLPPAAVVDDIIRSAATDDVTVQVTGN